MRNISFQHTKEQFRNRTKRVTRRLGWVNVKPGDKLMGVEKGMGLKPGEEIKRLGPIVVVSVRREKLSDITQEDVVLEGFPWMTGPEFVDFFSKNMNCDPDQEVTRIEFDYVEDQPTA